MLENHTIGVIVPAYNEEKLIGKTLSTMPDYVDTLIVVNDGSSDKTAKCIEEHKKNDRRIILIDHERNTGLGQSLIDGYVMSREMGIEVTAVMAGDAQMNPDDLENIVAPIIDGVADYTKGNRLFVQGVADHMPTYRLIGNALLTFLTKFATGYWHVVDPQCGYTAISGRALSVIPIERMTKGYGYNADILNMLNIQNITVADVEVEPVYGEEQSKITLYKYIPVVSLLLIRLFFRRLNQKYIMRNFNPLCLSYVFGLLLFWVVSVPLGIRLLYIYFNYSEFPQTTMLCLMFSSIASLQILLSAVQYDMEDNRDICVHSRPHRIKIKDKKHLGTMRDIQNPTAIEDGKEKDRISAGGGSQ